MNKIDILGYIIILLVLGICAYTYFASPEFNLTCIVVNEDGKKFCVRERENKAAAAKLLEEIADKAQQLVNYVYKKYPDNEDVVRLKEKFSKDVIMETLPNSQYTAYSENKGEKVSFCLNKTKDNNNNLIDSHTLMFVCIHEMSHIMTKSIGHDTTFWQNFKFLLENAEEAGIHIPRNYKEEPSEYCGMQIKDNPYYDM
jgi:predicted metal-dependent hydrolase